MASAAPVTSSTKETTNYARLCRLLVDIGTQALRDTLNAIHAPANLHTVLAANKATLQSLKAKRIINATQWGKLFPAIPNSVSSSNFDTTLLMVLLRNLCGLTTPPTGWDALPAVTDLSKEADIARVKFFRNTVYGHAEKASVDDIKFNDYWRDIRDTLIRLAGASYQAAIDTLRNETMDPDVEEHYMGLLSEWKKDEDNVKEELGEMKKMQEKIVHVQEKMLQALTSSKEVADQVTALHEIKLKVLPKDLDAEKHEILNQHFTTYISIFMKNNKLSSMEGMGEFLKYIEDSYNLLTRALGCGCLEIRVQCRNMESLERLWRDCCHGNLDRMAERCLVTNELIKKLDLKALRLNVVIKEEDYLACKESFSDVVGPLKEVSSSEVLPFDVPVCRRKLAEHYKRTATVPTSVSSKKCDVNIHQIYTRLSWVKEEQTPAGSSRAELSHYTDVLAENKNGLPSNRILVQGQTGIGKSTFVKKLAMDWAELDENRLTDEQRAILKKFELAVIIDLKKVSKHQSLSDVISASHSFAEEDTVMKDGLLSYITQNQDKVLLVFDGYDEYHYARNSEIFEIFRGNKLRNCCVLITTRISKADDLKEFQDVYAEITGFSEEDRKAFMIRMLGDEPQAEALRKHLFKRGVTDLVRVPLLLLFFCTLWKKGKQQSFPDSKTKLYVAIIQFVLDHNEGQCSSSNFRKVEDFTDILAEIGKVALECLLNDDHVFEYDQLSAAILCEESRIMGLLQVNEYAENIRPAGMLSFIHKSIQEFLAAWYITYRCVLKGNLGEINDRARTLDECRSLENVFRFICGLSEGGSVKVFEHLTSVRVSDSELDLSKTIPDEQRETDVTLSGVTNKQRSFINLVYDSFDEVESKTELLSHCLNCTEGIIFLSPDGRSISDIVPDRKILNEVSIRGVVFLDRWGYDEMTVLCESLEFLNCLHLPLKATENLAAVSAEELLKKFESVKCKGYCGLGCILHFHSDQTLFYLTELKLWCDDHAKLFTENFAPSHSSSLCPKSSSLKFLRFLHLGSASKEPTMRSFSTIIRDCKSFESFEMVVWNEDALECLEQIPNPLTCRLSLENHVFSNSLKSSGVLKLASLLPRFNNLIEFSFSLLNGCAEAENKLVCCITHKTLQELTLSNLRMTPAIAAALGRSLPEMSSLNKLSLVGREGSTVQVEDMKALFGGFNKVFPALKTFRFSRFSFRGGFAPLIERFHFFPNLWIVDLSNSNLNERDLRGLVCSLKSIPNMRILSLTSNPLGDENRVESIVKQALPQVYLYYW